MLVRLFIYAIRLSSDGYEKTKPPLILHGQGAAHYVMQFRIIRLRALLWEPL